MTCLRENEQGADLLIGYLEDTLTIDQRCEIDQHALGCSDCRELLAVQAMLDEFPVPEVSPDFDARLYARIAEEEAKPTLWSRFGAWLLRPALPLAAAAALAAGVFWMRPSEPVDEVKQKASVEKMDVQQLEQALEDLELLMPLTDEI